MRPLRPLLAFADGFGRKLTGARTRTGALVVVATLPWTLPAACFAIGEGVLPPVKRDTDAGPPPILHTDNPSSGTDLDASLPEPLPHSVTSVDPAHGPFNGGQHAIVLGTGFTSQVRVWFGANEVSASSVVPIDPGHVQVSVPAGSAGTVDVSAQNGDDASTRATLPQGYVYDSFYLDPSSGPVSGGTIVTLYGDGADWSLSTRVLIDGAPCNVTAVRTPAGAPEELDCETPPGTPGSKRVDVVTDAGTTELLDAFTYGDSDNGFRGGLDGSPLAGKLRVIAVNSYTGQAIANASVVLGTDTKSARTADANGVVEIDADLGKAVTVTIAAHCMMPTTFFDVAVDTVTAYLDPVLSPDCLSNGHPTIVGSGGGSPAAGATIQGELVWPNPIELKIAVWDVPAPPSLFTDADPDIRRVAYVFPLSSTVSTPFRLPAAKNGVTPSDYGRVGYTFSTSAAVGNVTLYALAGIENRKLSPPLFTAYTMGIVGGVATQAGATVKDVYVPMNIPLDHTLSLDARGPATTPRGPTELDGRVSVRYGDLGYVTLPVGSQSALLPVTAPLRFVGLPALANGLLGAEYVVTASASTGDNGGTPLSVVGLTGTTAVDTTVSLDGFLEVPLLDTPSDNSAWDGQTLATSAAKGGPDPDLTVFEIESGGGLSTWTVVMPRGVSSGTLPDLTALGDVGAPEGPVTITVSRAQIDGFDYGSLRYRQLTNRGWDAYATDVFQAHR
ncbi:MAG TPA: IPT/TIG domain-containing protein [Polyangiaceae bacterium]|nr:IPT/TIG domain-containing protein [Polyangiaceae bacterium]